MPLNEHKILVTGGTGFVGSHLLCKLFAQGIHPRVARRKGSSYNDLRLAFSFHFPDGGYSFDEFINTFEWVDADLLEYSSLQDAMEGINTVYHTAAFVSFLKKDKARLFDVTYKGTKNMVNAALVSGVKNFHHISSIASLNRNSEGIITEEFSDFDIKKSSNYAHSKYLAEMEVWRGYEEGLKGVIINPGVILGPGDVNRGSLKIFSYVKNNLKFYPVGKNGYVDVRDVVDALLYLSADKKLYANRYVLVAGSWYYKELFEKITIYAGTKAPSVRVLPWVAQLGYLALSAWSAVSGNKPALSRDLLRVANNEYEFDHSKVTGTGFNFRTLEDTVRDTCMFAFKRGEDNGV